MSAARERPADPRAPRARTALGRAARLRAPRSGHGDWEPGVHREDPVEILARQARGRVPELLALRYGRMLVSPFSFYRGAAAIMAGDLSGTPTSGLRVQLCGDAHLSNFGTFASAEREQVFDIVDFDETLPGPWEWDVKRLAASVWIAGRDRRFPRRKIAGSVSSTARAYREAMRAFAGQGNLEVWYARVDVADLARRLRTGVDIKRLGRLARRLERARSNTSVRALGRLTTTVDGTVRFLAKPPLLVPLDDLLGGENREDAERHVAQLVGGYRESLSADRRTLLDSYRYVSTARKVVGVGSVGTRDWVLLFDGRDGADALLLQAKEADASVLETHLGPAAEDSHGQRVIAGQKLVQSTGDVFLGWYTGPGPDGVECDYYLRQAADGKGAIDISLLEPKGLEAYAELCGWTLARAHARSGDRLAIAGYLGRGEVFDRAIVRFAERYANQNAADFQALQAAVASGRLPAATGRARPEDLSRGSGPRR